MGTHKETSEIKGDYRVQGKMTTFEKCTLDAKLIFLRSTA